MLKKIFLTFLHHLAEKNWNMTVPGFSGDEVKSFKKPVKFSDILIVLSCLQKKKRMMLEVINTAYTRCGSFHNLYETSFARLSWFVLQVTNDVHRERLAVVSHYGLPPH